MTSPPWQSQPDTSPPSPDIAAFSNPQAPSAAPSPSAGRCPPQRRATTTRRPVPASPSSSMNAIRLPAPSDRRRRGIGNAPASGFVPSGPSPSSGNPIRPATSAVNRPHSGRTGQRDARPEKPLAATTRSVLSDLRDWPIASSQRAKVKTLALLFLMFGWRCIRFADAGSGKSKVNLLIPESHPAIRRR